MADAETTTTTTEQKTETRDDATFYQNEAKKAFKARDEAKAELRKLQEAGLVLNEEQRDRMRELEASAAKAEEDRQKKAGEFDSLRAGLVKKHEAELEAERQGRQTAEKAISDLIIENAFAQSSDLFGAGARTIYSARAGQKVFEEFVRVDIVDGKRRLVVLGLDGQPILDAKTGQPASFAQAMSELLDELPDKDQHLRGSGKTGSGNSGGAHGSQTTGVVDFTKLKPGDFRDPKVRDAVKKQQATAGGLQMGRAWER